MFVTLWIFLDTIIVWAPSILYFTGLGMRNFQYEMRIYQKSHNKVTKTVQVWFEFLWIRRYFVLWQNLWSQDIYYIFPEWVQTAKNIPLTDGKNKFTFPNGICCHFRFCHDRKKYLLYCSISILGPISSFLLTCGNFLLQCSNCQSLRAEL